MMTARVNRFFPELAFGADVDRLMNSMFTPMAEPGRRGLGVFPALNVYESEQAFVVEAELPGFALTNLDISMTGPDLTIAGSRQETLPEGATLHRAERVGGAGGGAGGAKFSRTIRIGTPVDGDKVSATFEAGILTVTLPKSAAAKPRKIEVRTA